MLWLLSKPSSDSKVILYKGENITPVLKKNRATIKDITMFRKLLMVELKGIEVRCFLHALNCNNLEVCSYLHENGLVGIKELPDWAYQANCANLFKLENKSNPENEFDLNCIDINSTNITDLLAYALWLLKPSDSKVILYKGEKHHASFEKIEQL